MYGLGTIASQSLFYMHEGRSQRLTKEHSPMSTTTYRKDPAAVAKLSKPQFAVTQ